MGGNYQFASLVDEIAPFHIRYVNSHSSKPTSLDITETEYDIVPLMPRSSHRWRWTRRVRYHHAGHQISLGYEDGTDANEFMSNKVIALTGVSLHSGALYFTRLQQLIKFHDVIHPTTLQCELGGLENKEEEWL